MHLNEWIESRDCRELARLIPGYVTCSDGSVFIGDSRNPEPHIRVTENGFFDFESGMRGGYVILASLISREHNEPVCKKLTQFYRESLAAVEASEYEQQQMLRKNVSDLLGYID